MFSTTKSLGTMKEAMQRVKRLLCRKRVQTSRALLMGGPRVLMLSTRPGTRT
ncbi:hypothetical protein FOCG_18557 [Fusarium oxysporum f. sp. radicis-lycopersici 26381]|nr:hypothetical protein FOCG_18557 [Fusarium oxysporum f. sp. radicis-lycopersici 26381]EXL38809.1 hypothetical protein FOCG_18557 [Fusarium oxysporum f. sp. radicis-lycopersici 26381]